MIRSCFCTIAFQKNKWGADRRVETPLADIWPLLAEAGYDAIEIWWPHLEMLGRDERAELAASLQHAGLEVAMVSPYFDFTTSDASAQASIAQGMTVISAAREVGAAGIRCFTGKTGSAEATAEQWDRAVDGLQRLADAAGDLTFALETHARNLMDTPEATERLIKRIDRSNVGLIFQPSTFFADPQGALARLAPWTRHVHATNRRGNDRALLGEGELDYPALIAALRKAGFNGCISVEWMGDDPADVARQEAHYLRSILA